MSAWLRYYAIYCVLIAPLVAVDVFLIKSGVWHWLFLAVSIFACLLGASELQKRWWPDA
jgi:hypothetical protein